MPEESKHMACVKLGEDIESEVVEVENEHPVNTIPEQISALEKRQEELTLMMDNIFFVIKSMRDTAYRERDKVASAAMENMDAPAIPEGTVLNCSTKGLSYFLQVRDGAFFVGTTRYESLSAAAQGVSGVRRSGWSFWKLPDGRTIKEVFRK